MKSKSSELDMLESLLSLTEDFLDQMTTEAREEWELISARTADSAQRQKGGVVT